MTLRAEIDSMYRQIVEYGGNFGDPIDSGSFDPFALARSDSLIDYERAGVAVSILCLLENNIDNGDHGEVVRSQPAREARRFKNGGYFNDLPSVTRAIDALFESEDAYALALKDVYSSVVVPGVGDV